jgi:signal peptidase I
MDTTADTTVTKARKPWAAVMLSFFCPGLGHIYCGRIVAGSVLFAITMFFVPMASLMKVLNMTPAICVVFMVFLAVGTAASLYAVISSYFLAKRIGADYRLRDYNHATVYVALLVVAGLTSPTVFADMGFAFRRNVAEPFYCPAESMLPNLIKGDRFFVDKQAYRDAGPERGDIIVFLNPKDHRTNFIKRVVGLPGDRVEVRGGEVYLNGEKLPRDPMADAKMELSELPAGSSLFYETNGQRRYLILKSKGKSEVVDFPETEVPPSHVFVLGDNRDHATDSREFGPVPSGDIKGRAVYIYWPAGRWSRCGKVR